MTYDIIIVVKTKKTPKNQIVAHVVKILCQSDQQFQRKERKLTRMYVRTEGQMDVRTTQKHKASDNFVSGGINIGQYPSVLTW